MEPNQKTAIIHFLANEFKMQPEILNGDLNFQIDLDLTPDQVSNLIQRLQEALDLSLPDDQVSRVETVEDLLKIVDPDLDTEE